jgi:predicted RNase H-like nuclease (RuvC/YqgF family)
MKSDTDFANPYEKELDAQESKIKELEAKNGELNEKISWSCKINSSLEVRLADAELIRDCNASQRDAAMRSLKIAVEALELIGGKMEYYCAIGDHSKQCAAQEALEKIKGTK